MKNIIQILSDAGLEITDEQEKTIETGVNKGITRLLPSLKTGKKAIQSHTGKRQH